MAVWADLVRGVSPDPASTNPRTDYRKVAMEDGSFIYLGGALESHSFATAPWGAVMVDGLVSVSVVGSDGVIDGVRANNMTLAGPQLDLRNVNPLIDSAAGRWTNGEWFAQLIIQSGSSADRVRACWNVNLPPPPPVQGPGGQTVVYTVPLKRLMCGEYSKTAPGQDVGGYVVDDFNGQTKTFRGSW